MENKSIGAFWKKTSASGNKYWSGTIEIDGKKIQIVAFPNERKSKDIQPDVNIYLSKKREEVATVTQGEDQASDEIKTEDIPF